ncbi:MAG: alpha/beta hydrolase [Bacteroidia bacterium]|nr:alpha/beta hydrolase [Bacteroidia bacterium]
MYAISACQAERNELVANVNETIYVQSEGASMRVNLRGNLASKVVMLVVHGGPGGASYFYRTPAVGRLEAKYAVAYWDQRVAGASQGGSNNNTVVMAQYGEDLRKVILTLRHKYGADLQVFLMGQSWGGMVCAQFMTEGDNQELVSGWISANATHNWALNDSLTRVKLIEFGTEQIGSGKNVEKWQEIVDYCQANAGELTAEISTQLNFYAWEALELIEGFTPFDEDEVLRENLISERIPYTQAFLNLLNPANSNLSNSVIEVEFSSRLFRITKPVLALSGNYDFVVPEGNAIELIDSVSSAVKERKLFLHSGHNLEEQEAYVDAFIAFIDANK